MPSLNPRQFGGPDGPKQVYQYPDPVRVSPEQMAGAGQHQAASRADRLYERQYAQVPSMKDRLLHGDKVNPGNRELKRAYEGVSASSVAGAAVVGARAAASNQYWKSLGDYVAAHHELTDRAPRAGMGSGAAHSRSTDHAVIPETTVAGARINSAAAIGARGASAKSDPASMSVFKATYRR